MDLVQVSPNGSDPVVCKILDYGKYLFDKKKSLSSSKSKVKKTQLKEIKFRPSTDIGDFNIKLKKDKKALLMMEIRLKLASVLEVERFLNSDLGLEILNRLKNELSDIAIVDQEPSLEGRQLLMVLSRNERNNIMGYKLKTHSGASKTL